MRILKRFLACIQLLCVCRLGLHPQHKEPPKLGVEFELKLLAYTKPQQLWIRAMSITYTTAQGNAGSSTY